MNILVCIKRVPSPGTRIVLSEDKQEIVTKNLGFTISPHEECAIEEAIRVKEKFGGTVTVLTLGGSLASEQLRYAMAMGADEAILLQTDGKEWDPMATSNAISDAVKSKDFDLLLFGNESADYGGYQVAIRVAYALNHHCLTGVKSIEIDEGQITAGREAFGGMEIFKIPLPAVVSLKEGINLPRYPSLPGRMRAKRKQIEIIEPIKLPGGIETKQFVSPPELGSHVEILGHGVEAVPKLLSIIKELGFIHK